MLTQGCFDIIAVIEDALKTNLNATPLSEPLPIHRQIQLPDSRFSMAYMYISKVTVLFVLQSLVFSTPKETKSTTPVVSLSIYR